MKVRVTKKVADGLPVSIHTEFIQLQDFLKYVNAVSSGGMAKNLILDGQVQVNGQVCLQRGKKLRPGDAVGFLGNFWVIQGHDAE